MRETQRVPRVSARNQRIDPTALGGLKGTTMTQSIEIEKPNGAPVASAIVTTEPDDSRSLNAFSSMSSFETAQRMAKALSASSLLPETFRNNIPNCMIAMELANRIG